MTTIAKMTKEQLQEHIKNLDLALAVSRDENQRAWDRVGDYKETASGLQRTLAAANETITEFRRSDAKFSFTSGMIIFFFITGFFVGIILGAISSSSCR